MFVYNSYSGNSANSTEHWQTIDISTLFLSLHTIDKGLWEGIFRTIVGYSVTNMPKVSKFDVLQCTKVKVGN